ncbi:MAG: SDR family oxidoreductase [Nitrososphaeraceae archaeon]
MRVLVTGASGFLGSQIMDLYNKGEFNFTLYGTSTSQQNELFRLDITDVKSVREKILRLDPDCIINCAAMADVDQCERKPDLARAVNSIGAKNLAGICRSTGARLLQISTDSVFDGVVGGYTELSRPNPINAYAATKYDGEKAVISILRNYVVIRTNFYGHNHDGKYLMNWILSHLIDNERIIGFIDSRFNPLWIRDLAYCIIKLIDLPYRGILNCSGDEVFSKYQFIRKIALDLGYRNDNIQKGTSAQVPLTARRPNNTYLVNKKMHKLLKVKIHRLEEVLRHSEFDFYRSSMPKKI